MNTEQGIVIRADTKTAWIKTTKTGACESCSAKSSCHTLGGGKEMEVEAINEAGARIGDQVVIGFKTASLMKVSFLLYIFPILGLIAGAIVGEAVAPYFSMNKSLSALLIGGFVFFLCYLFIRKKGNELAKDNSYRPKVIRVLPAPQAISRI
jgi:sigma-E factor negative regulatory protein RseC